MLSRVIGAGKRALGLNPQGRAMTVFPDDTFLVSFPKSGNTWTRFLVANLLHPEEPATFINIDRLVPESESLNRRQLKQLSRPRVLKSHRPFEPAFRKVIYIVRDPRDVALSQYHFFRKRRRIDDNHDVDQFVTSFIAGKTCEFGSWQQNVISWLGTRHGTEGFLLLRYEDMIADTVQELGRIAEFLGIQPSGELLSRAAERSSADRMRELESAGGGNSIVTKNSRKDVAFVRSASSGGWKNGLTAESVSAMETAWAPLMAWLGYAVSTTQPQPSDGAGILQMALRNDSR